MGVTLSEALERLVVRMPLPEVKFLAIVISISTTSGGNLSEALGNLSQVLRDRFGMKLKVKALSAEAMASAMVLGSLPIAVVTLITLTSPDYLTPMIDTSQFWPERCGSARAPSLITTILFRLGRVALSGMSPIRRTSMARGQMVSPSKSSAWARRQ